MSYPKYKTALLVDDNFIDNMINQKILTNSDFTEKVIVKQSCEAAIEYLKELDKAELEFPEVIFLDVRMPVKTGFDFLLEFQEFKREKIRDIKVVMLSSSLDPNDHKKIIEFHNVVDFFGKPLTSELLKNL